MPGEIKESTVRGRVTWLLRLIRIDASFEEQELKWRVRIAWKSFGSERASFKDVIILDTAGISSMYAADGGVIVVV